MSTTSKPPLVPKAYLYPFILTTSLFALWGFANDFTNPLVRVFKEVFLISNFQSSLVQFAFYGGYFTMAIPAALLIRKKSYAWGIYVGLGLYALGALLTVPAALMSEFYLFLLGFYVLTFGLAFLETSANPYILSMGDPATATRRLSLAQAFNPAGSLTGMMVASFLILPNLGIQDFRAQEVAAHPEYAQMMPGAVDGKVTEAMVAFSQNDPTAHAKMVSHDLNLVIIPYVGIALVVLAVLTLFVRSKMPDAGDEGEQISLGQLLKRLQTFHYIGGVVAQMFYVGAQIMCWTFIVHYGMTLLGLSAAEAQGYNVIAMGIHLCGRFLCTYLLKYVNPGLMLASLAVGAFICTLGAVFVQGMPGLYCLIGISGCMSIMFPTIYGIALHGLTPNDAKLGSAGLIMAIVGGALMPPLQGLIIDGEGMNLLGASLESVRVSFLLPAVCFVAIMIYGFLANKLERKEHAVA